MLILDLSRQRLEDLAMTAVVRVVPKTVLAMTIVCPTWMVDDRVQANAVYVDAGRAGGVSLLAHVTKPIGAFIVFDTCFGNEDGLAIAILKLVEYFS